MNYRQFAILAGEYNPKRLMTDKLFWMCDNGLMPLIKYYRINRRIGGDRDIYILYKPNQNN